MQNKKILVCDDEPQLVDLLKVRLEANNYNVITAIDGFEAIEKARNNNPDLIILDLMLPKLNGYKVCRMLKFDDKYKHIPIIMFTARASQEDKKTGRETGADAYITKPFEPKLLLDKIKELIKK